MKSNTVTSLRLTKLDTADSKWRSFESCMALWKLWVWHLWRQCGFRETSQTIWKRFSRRECAVRGRGGGCNRKKDKEASSTSLIPDLLIDSIYGGPMFCFTFIDLCSTIFKKTWQREKKKQFLLLEWWRGWAHDCYMITELKLSRCMNGTQHCTSQTPPQRFPPDRDCSRLV